MRSSDDTILHFVTETGNEGLALYTDLSLYPFQMSDRISSSFYSLLEINCTKREQAKVLI